MRRSVSVALAVALGGCGGATDGRDIATPAAVAEIPPGSIPRGAGERRAALASPGPPVTPALLARGERAYAGKCAPCHGRSLAGDGPVVRAGFPSPGTLDIRSLSPEEVVRIVSHGRGDMPALAAEVPPAERWAIARWLERR